MAGNYQKTNNTKPSFNIIDVFILIFVVACFAGLIIRMGNFSVFEANEKLEDYRIHFEVTDISSVSEDYFKSGDTVTVAQSGVVLGELEIIDSISPTRVMVENENGEHVWVNYPSDTRVDVSGSIISSGIMDYNGFKVGGNTHVAAGESFLVHTEHMNFVLTVTKITKK
jgi:hypothetical protein